MKTLGLVLALVFVLGGAALAETVSYDIYAGWNLISAPVVPFNPDPLAVFAGAADGIDGVLTRNDASYGGISYDSLDPTGFGNVLLGDGFWLYQSQGGTVSYDGVPDGVPDAAGIKTDMWISLPGSQTDSGTDVPNGGGWHLIGQPFNHNTPVDDGSGTGVNILFTDGTTVKNWGAAVAAGWVDSFMTGNNAASGGFYVQYDGMGDDDHMRTGCGYWLHTYKDNLAMIVPANPAD